MCNSIAANSAIRPPLNIMLTQIFARRAAISSIRSFSSARVLASPEGPVNKDAFNDREKASENLYIKKQEKEQLKALREKLQKQKESIDKLEEEINKIKN